MILYSITDRQSLAGKLLESVDRQLQAGVDYLQIREKDLPGRQLFELTRAVLALPNPAGTRVMVNERADVAIAAGAAGVHLPADSVAPGEIRQIAPRGFVVAVSTHSLEEVRAAERAAVDFAVFGPVFATPSKNRWGPPQGLDALESVCRAVSLPVMAIGGITAEDATACVERGASGIAGISMFQAADFDPITALRTLSVG